MNNKFQIPSPLVSVEWLLQHLDAPNLIILDATLKKVTDSATESTDKKQLKNARFFDIKNVFSDQNSPLPNTILNAEDFEKEAQNLGINQDNAIVVYDDLGIYASPRAWWLFKSMGHSNVAVLDGGLPAWKEKKLPLENPKAYTGGLGNFKSMYDAALIETYQTVLKSINLEEMRIVDARSAGRFNALELEPREELRSGHIPSSKNIPYTAVLDGTTMKNKQVLETIFNESYQQKEKIIFSCGSGITACILALGAEIAGMKNLAVYDGSWTEWGSNHQLPIEK